MQITQRIAEDDRPVVHIRNLSITGFISPSAVYNFLNIPYASIPGRFRQALYLNPRSNGGSIDGARYGHPCYQPCDEPRDMRAHLYAGLESATWTQGPAEFSCLSLNVYTPVAAHQLKTSESKLPVLVWIHGGSWVLGDGNSDYGNLGLGLFPILPTCSCE